MSQDVLVSLFSSPGQKRFLGFTYSLMSDLLLLAYCNTVSFDLFADHEIRNILCRKHISVAPDPFVTVLKLSRPCINTSEWVQYSTLGLFLLCELKCCYLLLLISSSGNSFLLVLFL